LKYQRVDNLLSSIGKVIKDKNGVSIALDVAEPPVENGEDSHDEEVALAELYEVVHTKSIGIGIIYSNGIHVYH
jgi:hypothetical protein